MDRYKNIPVGYSNIHDIISEFKKGKMIVLPSSSSTVKTDLAIDIPILVLNI